jgi:hypothetical protein
VNVKRAAASAILGLFAVVEAAGRAGSNAKVTNENGTTVMTFPLTAPLAGITMKVPESVEKGQHE